MFMLRHLDTAATLYLCSTQMGLDKHNAEKLINKIIKFSSFWFLALKKVSRSRLDQIWNPFLYRAKFRNFWLTKNDLGATVGILNLVVFISLFIYLIGGVMFISAELGRAQILRGCRIQVKPIILPWPSMGFDVWVEKWATSQGGSIWTLFTISCEHIVAQPFDTLGHNSCSTWSI